MGVPWIPREHKFFDLFDRVVDIVARASQAFATMIAEFDRLEERGRELRDLEHECDLAVESILTALGQTFLTPFDRGDIHNLATGLDDVLDNMEETAFRVVSYRIGQPPAEAVDMAIIVLRSCEYLERAVRMCRRHLGSDDLVRVLREISRLENEADQIFRRVEADLFADPPDIMTFIKQRELYAWLEATVDSCRAVAHVINEIVVKGR
jgi:predicted phosphate transport protein (TIGR00153 family)